MKRIFFLLSAAVLLFCNAAFSQQSALFQLEHAPDTGMVIVTRNYLGIPGQPVYIYATDFFEYYGITPGGGGGGGGGSVDVISSVADTTGLSPEQGDFFVVDGAGGDTLGVYSGSQWYYFSVGGDGNGIISALPVEDVAVNANNHTLAITNMNNVLFSLDGLFTIQKNGASNMNFNAPDATIQLNGDRVALKGDTSVTLYDGSNPVFSVGQLGVAFEDLDYVPFSTGDTIIVLNKSFAKRMLFSDGVVNNPFGGENTLASVVDSLYSNISLLGPGGIYGGSGALPGVVDVEMQSGRYINFKHKGIFSITPTIQIQDSTLAGTQPGILFKRFDSSVMQFGYSSAYGYLSVNSGADFQLSTFSGGNIYLSPGTGFLLTGSGLTSTELPSTRPTGSTKFWGHNTSGTGSYFSPSEMVITNPWGGGNTIGGVVDSAYYAITSGLNGIISALPIGSVLIHAANHSFAVDSLSVFTLKTVQGVEVNANGEDLTLTVPATSGAELDINNLKDYDGTPNYILAQSISGITRRAPYEIITGTRVADPYTLTASTNLLQIGVDTADVFYLEPDNNLIEIRGIEAPSNNKYITIINTSDLTVNIINQSSLSTGPDIYCGGDVSLSAGRSIKLLYDGTRWTSVAADRSETDKQITSRFVVSSNTASDQNELFFGGVGAGTHTTEVASGSPLSPASVSINNNGGTSDGAYMYLGKGHANGIFTYGAHLSSSVTLALGQALSDTTYYATWGLCGNLTGNQDANNSIGFRLQVSGSAQTVVAYTRDASGNETTQVISSVLSSTGLALNFRVDVSSDMSEARFYVNGYQRATITSTMPTSGAGCSARAYMRKKSGTDSSTDEVFISKMKITGTY